MVLVSVYTVIALYALSIPVSISAIGKPRKPVTHGQAVFSVLFSIAAIACLSYVASQL